MRTRILAGLLLSATCFGTAWAQAPIARDLAFEMMAEPGRWIECDGKLQADRTFLVKEIEIYSLADTSNMEDLQIYGGIELIDRRRSKMKVMGYNVSWDKETTIKDEFKHRILSSKLKNGMGVKIQGHLRSDGTFWATKIKHKPRSMKDGKLKSAKQKMMGPVTVLDPHDGWLRIMNTDILVRPDCKYIDVPVEAEEAQTE